MTPPVSLVRGVNDDFKIIEELLSRVLEESTRPGHRSRVDQAEGQCDHVMVLTTTIETRFIKILKSSTGPDRPVLGLRHGLLTGPPTEDLENLKPSDRQFTVLLSKKTSWRRRLNNSLPPGVVLVLALSIIYVTTRGQHRRNPSMQMPSIQSPKPGIFSS